MTPTLKFHIKVNDMKMKHHRDYKNQPEKRAVRALDALWTQDAPRAVHAHVAVSHLLYLTATTARVDLRRKWCVIATHFVHRIYSLARIELSAEGKMSRRCA